MASRHANGKHLEQNLSCPTGAGMRSGPATHPAANASLRVPGLITPSAETPSTMFPPGSWGRTCRSRARAFMKACTVFRWNKSHLKVTGELLGSTRGTSAIRSLLKMEWHEVYATINKLQSWVFVFFSSDVYVFVGVWSRFNRGRSQRKLRILQMWRERGRLYAVLSPRV